MIHRVENDMDQVSADGVGLTIGTVSTNKIGFLGATPVTQIGVPTTAMATPTLAVVSAASGALAFSQFNKLVSLVTNLNTRMGECENVLSDFGLQA